MKTTITIISALLFFSSCQVNDAHKDSSVEGEWDGLIITECKIVILEENSGYEINLYQDDKHYVINTVDVLDDNMALPLGFYEPYELVGEFKHLTPTTLYFYSHDTTGKIIELPFSKK